jgi:hypothetical protein
MSYIVRARQVVLLLIIEEPMMHVQPLNYNMKVTFRSISITGFTITSHYYIIFFIHFKLFNQLRKNSVDMINFSEYAAYIYILDNEKITIATGK